MPRLNARGQALMGRSGGPASVDGRVIVLPGGGPASWLDDETIIVNTNARGSWEILSINVTNGFMRQLHAGGANAMAAGGGRWLCLASGTGLFGSLGSIPPAGLLCARPDGPLGH